MVAPVGKKQAGNMMSPDLEQNGGSLPMPNTAAGKIKGKGRGSKKGKWWRRNRTWLIALGFMLTVATMWMYVIDFSLSLPLSFPFLPPYFSKRELKLTKLFT